MVAETRRRSGARNPMAKRKHSPKNGDDAAVAAPSFVATKAFPIVSHPDDSRRETARKTAGQVTSPAAVHPPRKALPIVTHEDDTPDQAGERVGAQLAAPELAAWRVIAAAEKTSGLGEIIDTPGMLAALRAQGAAINAGNMNRVEAMLVNQATALQTLFVRLAERGLAQDSLPQYEAHMRLALKAQAQSRATLDTLTNVRNGPVIYARQANVAAGAPMQVNNELPAHAGARQIENPPNQLLEPPADDRMDARTPSSAGACDQPMEAVEAKHRAEDAGG
jgi:hypothetical protein